MDDTAVHATLVARVSQKLEPNRIRAERDLLDAGRSLERAREAQARATREVQAIQKAIANPRRFLELVAEFMVAAKGGQEALETFLATEEDRDLRRLLLRVRLDVELRAAGAELGKCQHPRYRGDLTPRWYKNTNPEGPSACPDCGQSAEAVRAEADQLRAQLDAAASTSIGSVLATARNEGAEEAADEHH